MLPKILWAGAELGLGSAALAVALYAAYVVKVKLRIDLFRPGGLHLPMPRRLWRRLTGQPLPPRRRPRTDQPGGRKL